MAKISDRIKSMQERAASLAPKQPALTTEPANEQAMEDVRAHFGATLDGLVRDRSIQRLPVGHIAPDTRPGMQQPRFLPLPDELMLNDQPAPVYRALVGELLALGQSLRERQIQPIVVYPGSIEQFPAARYLILVGQRRWTAAMLTGLPTLDAIIVDAPGSTDRVRIQYAENEDREEFSDMERAWALVQMKQALDDAPWENVEERLQMSRARRQQLLRLTAFSQPQQQQVARLRLHETQIRTLHTGLRNEQLSAAQVDGILYRLEQLSVERAAAQASDPAGATRRTGIEQTTIARLVARAQRTTPVAPVPAAPSPRWLGPLREQLTRAQQSLQRSIDRIESLSPRDAELLLQDAASLTATLATVVRQLQDGEPDSAEGERD